VARRKITLGLSPITAMMAAGAEIGAGTERILDAAAELMATHGLSRWSVDDVAELAGIGRTSVYRAFAARDDLVHAVLARELRQTLAAAQAAGAGHGRLEDQLVEGALTALNALRGSLVEKLLQSDPATLLPFLTTGAGPLIALSRHIMAQYARSSGIAVDEQQAAEAAEAAARLALSFILTRDTVFPVGDPEALRASLHRLLRPLLGPLSSARRRTA
jgi:AcrR family transcriptional regulator